MELSSPREWMSVRSLMTRLEGIGYLDICASFKYGVSDGHFDGVLCIDTYSLGAVVKVKVYLCR